MTGPERIDCDVTVTQLLLFQFPSYICSFHFFNRPMTGHVDTSLFLPVLKNDRVPERAGLLITPVRMIK